MRLVELVQPVVHDGFEQVEQVGLEPHEQRLRFRVAEAGVELQHARPLIGQHDARRRARRGTGTGPRFMAWTIGTNTVSSSFGDQLRRAERGRAVRAHAAGVRALVAVERPPCGPGVGGSGRMVRPPTRASTAELLAFQSLLDDDLPAGLARRTPRGP